MSTWYVVHSAATWAAAVFMQGERVLRLEEKMTPPTSPERILEWHQAMKSQVNFTNVEDHFFVTSVAKCVEWIQEAHKVTSIAPEVTARFLIEAGHEALAKDIREHAEKVDARGSARSVRNYREHAVNYWDKEDGKPADRFADLELQSIGKGRVDATSVIVTSEGRLIGGKLNVQHLMAAAEALHPQLFQICKDISRLDIPPARPPLI